jgi:hypothetical protein
MISIDVVATEDLMINLCYIRVQMTILFLLAEEVALIQLSGES